MVLLSKLITSSLTPPANLSSHKLFRPSFSNAGNKGRVTVPLSKTHTPRTLATIPSREVEPWFSAPVKGAAGGGEGSQGRIGLPMWTLCGFGFWVQGFRCFPWMALNFHMINGLGLSPATLQLVQSAGSLPMVAKPLFGFLSDAVYIGGDHRLPYISFGGGFSSLSTLPFFIIMFLYGIIFIIELTLSDAIMKTPTESSSR